MTADRLQELRRHGWRLTRDGSTATAQFYWEDPDDPENGWELLVLHTAGHGCRFSLDAVESGVTERSIEDAVRLHTALGEAMDLLQDWTGELPEDSG